MAMVDPQALVNAFIDSKLVAQGGTFHTTDMWRMMGVRKLATAKELHSKSRHIQGALHHDRIMTNGGFMHFVRTVYEMPDLAQEALHYCSALVIQWIEVTMKKAFQNMEEESLAFWTQDR